MRAEEMLRSKQIMLARTESIAHVGSWEWDITSDIVTWSDELFRIFQRDPREGAPSFAEHPALYLPEDMARLRQAVDAAIADGTPYELNSGPFGKMVRYGRVWRVESPKWRWVGGLSVCSAHFKTSPNRSGRKKH
jgi:hypothetical protein